MRSLQLFGFKQKQKDLLFEVNQFFEFIGQNKGTTEECELRTQNENLQPQWQSKTKVSLWHCELKCVHSLRCRKASTVLSLHAYHQGDKWITSAALTRNRFVQMNNRWSEGRELHVTVTGIRQNGCCETSTGIYDGPLKDIVSIIMVFVTRVAHHTH